MSDSKQISDKLWNYCSILRDDGLSYGDYVEQLTFLLFLKMDDERGKPPHNKKSDIPKGLNWQSLIEKDGAELEAHYIKVLNDLGKEDGIIGVIFRKAQNKIQDPAKLRKLIADLIDRENWLSLEVDVKGDAYEGLLERNAADVKGGAGETIRKKLLQACDLHTILRLPTGIFYAQGVKANVFFFDKKEAGKDFVTKKVWIYDLRTNMHVTLKENTLKEEDLEDFIKCYNAENRHDHKQTWSEKKNPDGRWRSFDIDEILKRDKTNLDIFWIKDESLEDVDNLPDPDVIANELVEELQDALEQLQEIAGDLGK